MGKKIPEQSRKHKLDLEMPFWVSGASPGHPEAGFFAFEKQKKYKPVLSRWLSRSRTSSSYAKASEDK